MNAKWLVRFVVLLVALLFSVGLSSLSVPQTAYAATCSVNQLWIVPAGDLTRGTVAIVHWRSNCGTTQLHIRFDGQDDVYNEIGAPDNDWKWTTSDERFGNAIDYHLCVWGRGEGGWDNADKSKCLDVRVTGGEGSPPGTGNDGADTECWVSSFSFTPATVVQGNFISLTVAGQCNGGASTMYFTKDGQAFSQYPAGGSHTDTLNSGELSVGYHTLCGVVTNGQATPARSCAGLTVLPSGSNQPPPDTGDGGSSSNKPTQVPSSGGDNSCDLGASQLSVGDQPTVARGHGPMSVYKKPSMNSQYVGSIPVGASFSLVGGPICKDGLIWWEVGNPGISGYSMERTVNNQPAMVPQGGTSGGDGTCTLDSLFIADVTIPDGKRARPGKEFVKTWRMENNGTCAWRNVYLQWVGDTSFCMVPVDVSSANPGEAVDVSVTCTAPSSVGDWTQTFRMFYGSVPFGDKPYVQIHVQGEPIEQPQATEEVKDWGDPPWPFNQAPGAQAWSYDCEPQCTEYARQLRPDARDWSSGNPVAWINEARMSNFTWNGVLSRVRVRSAGESPQENDIAIWSAGCQGAPSGGHAGVVGKNDDGWHFKESNWGKQYEPGKITCDKGERIINPIPGCISFITSPEPVTASQNQPSPGTSPAVAPQKKPDWCWLFNWMPNDWAAKPKECKP